MVRPVIQSENHKTAGFYTEKRTIRDGRVLLYKRRGHARGMWQCRIKLVGARGYVVKSSGTANYEEAVEFAGALFDDLRQRIKDRRPIRKHTFMDVYEIWLDSLNVAPSRYEYHDKTGGRYFRQLILW